MYADLNDINLFKLIKLSDITNTILEIGKENNVSDADIITFSAFLFCITNKTKTELNKLLSEIFLYNKAEIKRIINDKDDYIVKIMESFAVNFYKKYTSIRLSNMLDVDIKDISTNLNLEYHKFIYSFLKDSYSNLHDDDLTEMFVSHLDSYDYTNAIRIYFLTLVLERYYLIEEFNVIQYEKCKNNFIYALNSEIILATNLLVRYGKGNKIDLLSEETIEMCNNAIEETNTNAIDIQQYYITKNSELESRIKDLELEIMNLHKNISGLVAKIEENNILKKLEGKNILVIADEGRKDGYKEIVEKYGGNFEFLSGVNVKSGTALRRSEANDIVIYMTTYAKHEIYDSIRHLDNIYYIHSTGLASLESKLLELIS